MGIKVQFNKDNEVWTIWGARVRTDIDPISGLTVLILCYLERNGLQVADYGIMLNGEAAITAYNSWQNHHGLYITILREMGITEEVIDTIPNMNNEFSEWMNK